MNQKKINEWHFLIELLKVLKPAHSLWNVMLFLKLLSEIHIMFWAAQMKSHWPPNYIGLAQTFQSLGT